MSNTAVQNIISTRTQAEHAVLVSGGSNFGQDKTYDLKNHREPLKAYKNHFSKISISLFCDSIYSTFDILLEILEGGLR